jgi:hypothetical protein
LLVFVVGISSGGGPGYGTAWVVVYRIIWKSKQRVEEEEEEEVEIEEVVERFQMNKIKNRNQTRRNEKSSRLREREKVRNTKNPLQLEMRIQTERRPRNGRCLKNNM